MRHRHRLHWFAMLAAACAALVPACEKGTGPQVPTTVVLSASTVSLNAIGATQTLTATVTDQTGNGIAKPVVTWSSSNTAVATVSSTGVVAAVANGTADVTGGSGTVTSSPATVTVAQLPASIVKVSGDLQAGVVGQALGAALVVQVNDRLANPIPNATVNFSVTQGGGGVGTASASTPANGRAQTTWTLGTTAGTNHQVTVSAPGGSATAVTFGATATAAGAVAVAAVSGNNQTGIFSAALASPIVVKVTDQFNNPKSGTTVSFSVTGGGGSVNPTSLLTGANGQAQATWTLGPSVTSQSAQAAVTGLTGSPVPFAATGSDLTTVSIVQDTLIEGQSITVNGTGYSATPASNTVTIDGAAATVTAASTTQLTVTVPAYDCKPARDGGVQVTVGAFTSNTVTKRIHPSSFVTLAVGAQQIVQTPANFCLQFRPSTTGGDGYLVGVGAAAESPGTLFPITISTGTGAASAPIFASSAALPLPGDGVTAGQRVQTAAEAEVDQLWMRQYQAETKIRAWERDRLPQLVRHSRGVAAAPRVAGPFTAAPSVGDTLRVRVPDFSVDGCANYTEILTKVKAVGTAGIWVRDPANPGPDSLTDAEIQAYSDTFDTKIYVGDTTFFGVPSDVDNNQRVLIVMTIAVNREPVGAAGFVFGGDLYPRGLPCASSNFGEVFYGQVPDPGNVAGTGVRSHAAVSFQMPSLIAHEFSHDIQLSRRLVLAMGNAMNAWEMEGQAMLAQEVVGHQVLGNAAGQNYTSAVALAGQGLRWYGQGFELLGSYFGSQYFMAGKNANAPEQCSLYASTLTSTACFNFAFYGASWSFQRYILDRFGPGYTGGPTKLTRDVISKNVNLVGRANWQALLGLTPAGYDSVYAQWGAMLYVDDRVPAVTAMQQMSSWNLFNVINGFGSTDYQLIPTVRTFTGFSDARSVRGGGTAYTTISAAGARPALAVKVRDGGGAVIGAAMRAQVWVTRIQ